MAVKKKRRKRKSAKVGRPKKEPTESVRVAESSRALILKTVRKHGLSMRSATEMLIELGYTYDNEDTPS